MRWEFHLTLNGSWVRNTYWSQGFNDFFKTYDEIYKQLIKDGKWEEIKPVQKMENMLFEDAGKNRIFCWKKKCFGLLTPHKIAFQLMSSWIKIKFNLTNSNRRIYLRDEESLIWIDISTNYHHQQTVVTTWRNYDTYFFAEKSWKILCLSFLNILILIHS